MTHPTFSVVVPAYNASPTIASAVRSVLAQSRDDFELIVADDGSTDDTAEQVHAFESDRRVKLIRQENAGPAAARNAAIANACGRYVSFLDSDDLLMPNYLEVMGGALDTHKHADLAYTKAWVLDNATRRIRRRSALEGKRTPVRPPQEPSAFLALLLKRNFIFVSTTVRRSVFDEVGGFDTHLRRAHDYEMWLRIAANGHRVVRVPGRHAIYRARDDSLSSDQTLVLKSLREIQRKVAEEYDVSDSIRSIARGHMKRFDAVVKIREGNKRAAPLYMRAAMRLIQVKQARLPGPATHGTPPPEVAAAFPDLDSV